MSWSQRAFWRAYAAAYDLIWDSPVMAVLASRIAQAVGSAADVVDLGCGTGLASGGLSESQVLGVDNSAAMVRRAFATGRIQGKLTAEAANTGLRAGSASAVIVANVLHLHPAPADVLKEALRLLQPGGVAVVTWPGEEATPTAIWRAQREGWWPWWRAALGASLSLYFSVVAAIGGVRRRESAEVAYNVADAAAATTDVALILKEKVLGLQWIAVLQRSG